MPPRKRSQKVHESKIVGYVTNLVDDGMGNITIDGYLLDQNVATMIARSDLQESSLYVDSDQKKSLNYLRAAFSWVVAIILVLMFFGALSIDRIYKAVRYRNALHLKGKG